MPEPLSVRRVAPLFDIQYVVPSEELLDRYLAYPLCGVTGLRSCGYDRWRLEFDESVRTFGLVRPRHGACIDRVLAANSLYNLAGLGIADFLSTEDPFPVFTRGVGFLRSELLLESPSIGLEGGICLFQPGELLLTLGNSRESVVDLYYEASRSPELAASIQAFGVDGVRCLRRAPSVQDYLHLYRLLSFAAALDAPAVVGVPDAEYLAEADRIIGKGKTEECGLAGLIKASSGQVREVVRRIAGRVGATVVINSLDADQSIREAMEGAMAGVRSAGEGVPTATPSGRRDLLGYLAMPLVPGHLFRCGLTLGVLPVGEKRTVRVLSRLFPSRRAAFVMFPDLPVEVTAGNADQRIVRAQLAEAVFHAAQTDLSALPPLPGWASTPDSWSDSRSER